MLQIYGRGTTLTFGTDTLRSIDFALSGNVVISRGITQQVSISGPEDVVLDINTIVSDGHWQIGTRHCFRKYDPVTIRLQSVDRWRATLTGAGDQRFRSVDQA